MSNTPASGSGSKKRRSTLDSYKKLLENEVKNLSGRISTLTSSNSHLSMELAGVLEHVEDLGEKVAEFDSVIESSKVQELVIDSLQDEVKKLDQRIDFLTAELTSAKSLISQQQSMIEVLIQRSLESGNGKVKVPEEDRRGSRTVTPLYGVPIMTPS